MTEISRRSVLLGLGGTVLAGPLLAACTSGSSVGGFDEPAALTTPPDWDYPILEGSTLPFGHSVASGDPRPDRVILWTRLTVPDPEADGIDAADVTWRIATDRALTDVVAEGTARTDAGHDWTVKVEPSGLAAGTDHWFAFDALGHTSPVGRTRTAPADLAEGVTVAAVSCSSYWSGPFNAYTRIAEREDVDLVVHAGDHIYDNPDGRQWTRARLDRFDPEHVDFRNWRSVEENARRYALYYADPDCAALRAAKPMTVAWDNHDIDRGVDDVLADGESQAVFWRWTPCRPPDATTVDGQVVAADPTVGHRRVGYGPVDLFVLDAHSWADDVSLLGEAQRRWLEEELTRSGGEDVPWRLVVTPKPLGHFEAGGEPAYPGWSDRDGDRAHLLDHLLAEGIGDNVFVSGDAHGAFAWDLPPDQSPAGYDPKTGEGSAGVEILCNSVNRVGADENIAGAQYEAAHDGSPPHEDRETFRELLDGARPLGEATGAALVAENPSMHYANWIDHGYAVLAFTPEEAVLESWIVPHLEASDQQTLDVRFRVVAGTDHLVAEA